MKRQKSSLIGTELPEVSNVIALPPTIEKSISPKKHFTEFVRERARQIVNTTLLRNTKLQLQLEYPNDKTPSKTTITRIITERGLLAKAQAVIALQSIKGVASLGMDEASSRHQSILVINAIGT